MDKNIFDFTNYKTYLNYRIDHSPKRGRGLKLSMATYMGSPVSHISQVLNDQSNLTLEQAEEVNSFWQHTEEEGQFFLLLVQSARAGTPKLKERFRQQIQNILEKRLILKERLGVKSEINPADQATFYSSWFYGAAHVIVSIPQYQKREDIARRLNLSLSKTTEILDFLVRIGLIVEAKNGYKIGTSRIHLGADSPMISKFHTNWRIKAIQSLEKEDALKDLHYSSVITLSHEDFTKIKTLLVKNIDETKKIIRESKEETIGVFSLDFFQI